MTQFSFSFEKGSSLALFLCSSFFWIYHITSSALSDKHRARWPSISSCDSLQTENWFSEEQSQIHLFILCFTFTPSFPMQLQKCSSSLLGKSFLCHSRSCCYLLLGGLTVSLTRGQCSHPTSSGQAVLSLEIGGCWYSMI